MGFRVGGRLGPFSASTGVSSREAGGCLTLVLQLAALAIALFIAITLLPVAAIYAGWRLHSRGTTSAKNAGIALALVGVVGGGFLWHWEYTAIRYSKDLPYSLDGSVAEAKRKLADEGFTKVSLDPGPGPLSDSCEVASSTPAEGERGDTRKPVVLHLDCPVLELTGTVVSASAGGVRVADADGLTKNYELAQVSDYGSGPSECLSDWIDRKRTMLVAHALRVGAPVRVVFQNPRDPKRVYVFVGDHGSTTPVNVGLVASGYFSRDDSDDPTPADRTVNRAMVAAEIRGNQAQAQILKSCPRS